MDIVICSVLISVLQLSVAQVPKHNPCASSPCRNEGTCGHPPLGAGQTLDPYICICPAPYTGQQCQNEVICSEGSFYHLQFTNCTACPAGTYNPDAGTLGQCIPCPSDEVGCNSTTDDEGSVNITECYFEPYIREMFPTFGPVAGGTVITIEIDYINDTMIELVEVINDTCEIVANHSIGVTTVVVCSTRNVTNTSSGPVTVFLADGTELVAAENYTYKHNPIVTGLHPLKTFISGGLRLTITGSNLDSVASPALDVIRIHKGQSRVFTQGCSVVDSDELHCPIPNLGAGLSHPLFRSDPSVDKNPRSRRHAESRHARARRDTPTFNGEDTSFFLGAQFDGVDAYQNFSETLPDIGQLLVYPDPVYHPFETKNHIKHYYYEEEEFLHIKGKYLDYASVLEDIIITIGIERCNVTFLATNLLTCSPPLVQPGSEETGAGPGDLPRVTVYVGSLTYVIGFLEYVEKFKLTDVVLGIIIALILVVMVIAIVTVCVIVKRRKKSQEITRLRRESNIYMDINNRDDRISDTHAIRPMSMFVSPPTSPVGNNPLSVTSFDLWPAGQYLEARGSITFDILEVLDVDLRMTLEDCHIDSKNLTLKEVIGQGSQCSVDDVVSFLHEAVMMRDFNHTNVLSLLGVVVNSNKPYVILPYMEHGDLKSYITDASRQLRVRELLEFGIQIACGMVYLSKHKFVHRDLATRNCMINKELCVKIADFGLSRDIYNMDYYKMEDKRKPLPVKWMGIECLQSGIYTTMSDVWSYGVVLWELLTRGCTPYPDVDSFSIKQYLLTGRRLAQPLHCPWHIYDIMQQCWRPEPELRPGFDTIHQELTLLTDQMSSFNNPDYMQSTSSDYLKPVDVLY